MTDLAPTRSAPSARPTTSAKALWFRTTCRIAASGWRSHCSTVACTRSTTSAPAPRERCPLSGGLLTGTTITCQCHGSRFDIPTGAVISGPATEALTVYEVRAVRRDDPGPERTVIDFGEESMFGTNHPLAS